jgi:hypothetical protein
MSRAKEPSPAQSRAILAGVCLIFISAGLGLWIPFFLLPTLEWWNMRTWKPAPCTIVRSPAGKGESGGIEVVFRYEWDGASYDSSTLGAGGLFGTGDGPLWSVPPGTTRTCYVNPRDAHQASLNRDFDPETLFGCAPLLFVILPLAALLLAWKNIGKPPEEIAPLPPLREGARSIPPSPRGGCGVGAMLVLLLLTGGGALALALFVAPAAGGIVYVYAAPLALFALLLLLVLVHIGLASFNPSAVLTLTPGQISPGQTLELRWETTGDIARVKSFRIVLEGREEAFIGKSLRTQPFSTVDVFQAGSRDFRRGTVKVTLPATAMHSMVHGTRKIVWAFKVVAECPRWRRGGEEYVFEVLPRKAGPS